MSTTYLLWVSAILLQAVVLARGFQQRMFSDYRLFYSYIGFTVSISLIRLLLSVTLGLGSAYYYHLFHVGNFLADILMLAVLGNIYQRVFGYPKVTWKGVRLWVSLVAIMLIALGFKVFTVPRIGLYTSFHAFTLPILVGACLVVCRAVCLQREVDLGRNLKGILSGCSLLVALQAINFTHFLFFEGSFRVFGFFVQFVYFIALIVFIYTLWDYEPLYRLQTLEQRQLSEVNEKLQRALKSLLLPR